MEKQRKEWWCCLRQSLTKVCRKGSVRRGSHFTLEGAEPRGRDRGEMMMLQGGRGLLR